MYDYHRVWLEAHSEYDEVWLSQALSAGFDIHHIDGDHSNDDPDNLLLIEKSDHAKLHGQYSNLLNSAERNSWGGYAEKLTRGEKAYNLRVSGLKWRDVAKQLGYLATPAALSVAKAYATYHGKRWPIAHADGCVCHRCKAARNNF